MTDTEITNMANVADANGYDPDSSVADLTATAGRTDAPIEFHIQMHGHTQRDMEALVIEAAAQIIIGRSSKDSLAGLIEKRCQTLLIEKANKVLDGLTTEIIDHPVTPTFGDKKPVTMREFIGLTGREYLSTPVDSRGRARGEDGFGTYYGRDTTPRIQHLVRSVMDSRFKDEIGKATNAAINEFRSELKKRHEAIVAEEMARFRDAMKKAQE